MQETLFKVRYFEGGLSKNLKRVNLIFLLYPVPFYGQDYEKQKGPLTGYQFFFGLHNMFRKIPFLVTWAILII